MQRVIKCKRDTSRKTGILIFSGFLLLLPLLILAAGCAPGAFPGEPQQPAPQNDLEEETAMKQESFVHTRPPIDQNLPETLETATFALG